MLVIHSVNDAELADWLGLDPNRMTWIVNGRKLHSIDKVIAQAAPNSLPMLMATSASKHEELIANENALWYSNLKLSLISTRQHVMGWLHVILVFFTSIFITPTRNEHEE